MNIKNMFSKINIGVNLILWVGLFCFTSCHSIDEAENTATGNFDMLWTILDEHYCFFEYKDIDWDEIKIKYRTQAQNATTGKQLFRIMAAMLDELKDGHVNLSAPFESSYYRAWWSDFPQNYNERLVQEKYMFFHYSQLGPVSYYLLPSNVGYLRIPTFDVGLGDGNIDYILAAFQIASALIIDIRDNGGGSMTVADDWISHFIGYEICTGYISHKTGPGHNDFSEPYEMRVKPVTVGHWIWGKPVVVLTNRSTFSAANYFATVMKSLPNVTLVGAKTGGGAGMPFSAELPCGWGVRFSAVPIYAPDSTLTEFGVDPSPGCAVDMSPADELAGKDTMLDFAISLLTTPK
ncbi:MAG: S41 family peptidase [Paramuribaculum sp.]|nr:S41 family peptidase [Paramuribaculum sp.]